MSGRIKGLFIGFVGFMLGAVLTPFVHGQSGKLEGNLTHIGFAVRDADKAAKEFAELFGVEVPAPLMLRDVPYLPSSGGSFQKMNVKVIGLNVAGFRFELLQGLGDSLWNDYIAKRGEGFHHIAVSVPDVAKTRDMFLARGRKTTLTFNGTAYVDLQPKTFPLTVEVNAAPSSSGQR